jgi:hypothetical protein
MYIIMTMSEVGRDTLDRGRSLLLTFQVSSARLSGFARRDCEA